MVESRAGAVRGLRRRPRSAVARTAAPEDPGHRGIEGVSLTDRVAAWLLALALAVLLLSACAGKIPHSLQTGYKDAGIRLIAVLPVRGDAQDPRVARLLREKVFAGLYFKGYPKIPLGLIDERLVGLYGKQGAPDGVVPPQAAGQLLGIDAVLYISLIECRTAYRPLYAPTTVAVRLELRSAKTGETLWSVQDRTGERNFDFTTKGLEMKSTQVYEEALQAVVGRMLDTLPDGPDHLG